MNNKFRNSTIQVHLAQGRPILLPLSEPEGTFNGRVERNSAQAQLFKKCPLKVKHLRCRPCWDIGASIPIRGWDQWQCKPSSPSTTTHTSTLLQPRGKSPVKRHSDILRRPRTRALKEKRDFQASRARSRTWTSMTKSFKGTSLQLLRAHINARHP
jgi:hypothetical protein